MGKNFSYEMLRGVKLGWSGWHCSPYPLLDYLRDLRFFGISSGVAFGRLIGDQELLGSCADIVLEHGIFVCPFEQIIHSYMGFLARDSKKGVLEQILILKNWRTTSML